MIEQVPGSYIHEAGWGELFPSWASFSVPRAGWEWCEIMNRLYTTSLPNTINRMVGD